MEVVWTDYLKYRAMFRGYDLAKIEPIVRHSSERYFDTATQRLVAIGRHDDILVMVPCEIAGDNFIPITVHATTRRQINFRLRSGRFCHE